MATIAEQVDKALKNFAKDDIYKSIISDVDGVPAGTINNHTDYNIGQIAGALEYNRQLTASLLKQINLNTAEGRWLDYIIHDHIGLIRHSGENDLEYVDRITEYIIGHKNSPGAIINFFRRYSPGGEPEILEGEQDCAFADLSFADVYTGFVETATGYYVFPALACGADSQAFFFILVLYNTLDSDIPAVIDALNKYKMSAVETEIQIRY